MESTSTTLSARKRSVGVKIFSCLFIIFALISLLGSKKYVTYSGVKFILGFVLPIFSLASGIYILMLKEWARKLVIVIRVIAITYLLFNFVTLKNAFSKGLSDEEISKMKESFSIKVENNLEKYRPEYQKEQRAFYEKMLGQSVKLAPFFAYGVNTIALFWNLSIIFYFTRPKVKRQFANDKGAESQTE